MKILVAYDGSVCGDGALYDLARAGLPARAEVLVISITIPIFPAGRGEPVKESGVRGPSGRSLSARRRGHGGALAGWSTVAMDRAKENAAAAIEEARASAERAGRYLALRFPGWKVKVEAFEAAPARGILDRARAWDPDLIVLGSHGRTALGRLLLGSVSEKVLLHARNNVRISRARIGTGGRAPRILVALDGSAASMTAMEAVAARAWPAGTAVRVVAALTTGEAMAQAMEGFEAGSPRGTSHSAWIERRLEAAAAKIAAPGIRVTSEILMGEPRETLLNAARTWGADCIFVGSRGRNSRERFLLGGVTSAVAAHAPCSVEIIRKARSGKGTDSRPARRAEKTASGKVRGAGSGSGKSGSAKAKTGKANGNLRPKRPRPIVRPLNRD